MQSGQPVLNGEGKVQNAEAHGTNGMTNHAITDVGLGKPADTVLRSPVQFRRNPRSGTGKGVPESAPLPRISPSLLRWFTWYCRRYLRRHFHSLRVSRAGRAPRTTNRPLVIYSNHASWWDALVCLVLKDIFFPGRTAFAPIDAAMLERYKFFHYLGFFGVEQQSPRGAARFLRTSEAVLQSAQNLLALTPQGSFADVRQRPVRFAGGIGHLAARVPHALFVPVALEYVFWEERLPEILVRFGPAVDARRPEVGFSDAGRWTRFFEQQLADTQDALAAEAQRRGTDDFETLLRGGAGQGGIYDAWRAFRARCRGEAFHREHGNK